MSTTINSYAQLSEYLDGILAANGETPVGGPHGAFWNSLSYQDFTTGAVPHVTGPDGKPMKILVVGNSKASNLILALQGKAGTVQHRLVGRHERRSSLALAAWLLAGGL
jgi:hypothetical protein